MRSILIAILLAAVMTASANSAVVESNVPLVRLLSAPERYSGKAITVSGVLHRSEDGVLALYLDPSSAEAGVTGNAIVLLLSIPQPAQVSEEQVFEGLGKYVLVSATFDAGSPRPRGYSGRLQAVEFLRPYPLLRPLLNEWDVGVAQAEQIILAVRDIWQKELREQTDELGKIGRQRKSLFLTCPMENISGIRKRMGNDDEIVVTFSKKGVSGFLSLVISFDRESKYTYEFFEALP